MWSDGPAKPETRAGFDRAPADLRLYGTRTENRRAQKRGRDQRPTAVTTAAMDPTAAATAAIMTLVHRRGPSLSPH